MHELKGIAVSPGIAIGEALVIDNGGFVISRRAIERGRADEELARLDRAIAVVSGEIERDREAVSERLGPQYGAIFSAHSQMLQDPRLHAELEQLVRDSLLSPEWAVRKTLRRYAQVFQEMTLSHLADRAHDLYDLEARLLEQLLDRRREALADLNAPTIVLAHDLTPSQTARLNRRWVRGFATESGGEGGHTAILAKGLEIPAVVGSGPLLGDVTCGELVIVDGDRGLVIVQPDQPVLDRYRREAEQQRCHIAALAGFRGLPAQTADGTRIQLMANIEFPDEVAACRDRGADGIGLYRTEFLYLGSDSEPTEEDHYQAYRQVVLAMGDRPVVIRTLDLGADKVGHGPRIEDEHNPFLGLRSIRLSLRNVDLFRTQLRAILRQCPGTHRAPLPAGHDPQGAAAGEVVSPRHHGGSGRGGHRV